MVVGGHRRQCAFRTSACPMGSTSVLQIRSIFASLIARCDLPLTPAQHCQEQHRLCDGTSVVLWNYQSFRASGYAQRPSGESLDHLHMITVQVYSFLRLGSYTANDRPCHAEHRQLGAQRWLPNLCCILPQHASCLPAAASGAKLPGRLQLSVWWRLQGRSQQLPVQL